MNNYRHIGGSALAAALLLSAAGLSLAAGKGKPRGLPRYGVAVYSDLCVQRDNGDFGGQRVSLHRYAEADTVVYEFTAGSLSWPLVSSEVNLDSKSGAIDFTVTGADNEQRTISGKFSPDGSSLTLDGSYCGGAVNMPMRLSRVSDFGRKLGACKPCPAVPSAPAAPAPTETPQAAPAEMPAEMPAA